MGACSYLLLYILSRLSAYTLKKPRQLARWRGEDGMWESITNYLFSKGAIYEKATHLLDLR